VQDVQRLSPGRAEEAGDEREGGMSRRQVQESLFAATGTTSFGACATNIRLRAEIPAGSRQDALRIACESSREQPGIAWTAFRVDQNGAVSLATFMGGAMTFRALSEATDEEDAA
jgi:hypothetical protein